jgi:hypothetical protein
MIVNQATNLSGLQLRKASHFDLTHASKRHEPCPCIIWIVELIITYAHKHYLSNFRIIWIVELTHTDVGEEVIFTHLGQDARDLFLKRRNQSISSLWKVACLVLSGHVLGLQVNRD